MQDWQTQKILIFEIFFRGLHFASLDVQVPVVDFNSILFSNMLSQVSSLKTWTEKPPVNLFTLVNVWGIWQRPSLMPDHFSAGLKKFLDKYEARDFLLTMLNERR